MTKTSSIEVWGGEAIGDKAGMLRDHEQLVKEYGFQVPPTIVLASEAVKSMVGRVLPTEESTLTDPSELTKTIWNIVDTFAGVPAIAVRSSAEGDARGSGIYESKIVPPNRKEVCEAVHDVVASFWTPVARNFREDLQLSDDFAVMIQPMVGQRLDETEDAPYAPPLSGIAYSSTRVHSDGFLKVVAGFGGGVDRQGAERITAEALEELSGSRFARYLNLARWNSFLDEEGIPDETKPITLNELVFARAQAEAERKLKGQSDFRDRQRAYFYDAEGSVRGKTFLDGQMAVCPIEKFVYEVVDGKIVKVPAPLQLAMDSFEPAAFLATMQQMEQRVGQPLYAEWAATVVGGTIVPWIVQISPAERKDLSEVDKVEFNQLYYRANSVVGSGRKTANRIVRCWNAGSLEHLRAYNDDPENEGYVLIYSARLTSVITSNTDSLYFQDCYRAAVILEEQDIGHDSSGQIEHILGAVDVTNKFFGVIEGQTEDESMHSARDGLRVEAWSSPKAASTAHPLKIIEGDFTVVADELNDRLFVGKV